MHKPLIFPAMAQHDIDNFFDPLLVHGTVRGRLQSTITDKDHGIALLMPTGTIADIRFMIFS